MTKLNKAMIQKLRMTKRVHFCHVDAGNITQATHTLFDQRARFFVPQNDKASPVLSCWRRKHHTSNSHPVRHSAGISSTTPTKFVMLTQETSHKQLTHYLISVCDSSSLRMTKRAPFCHVDAGNITQATHTLFV